MRALNITPIESPFGECKAQTPETPFICSVENWLWITGMLRQDHATTLKGLLCPAPDEASGRRTQQLCPQNYGPQRPHKQKEPTKIASGIPCVLGRRTGMS